MSCELGIGKRESLFFSSPSLLLRFLPSRSPFSFPLTRRRGFQGDPQLKTRLASILKDKRRVGRTGTEGRGKGSAGGGGGRGSALGSASTKREINREIMSGKEERMGGRDRGGREGEGPEAPLVLAQLEGGEAGEEGGRKRHVFMEE